MGVVVVSGELSQELSDSIYEQLRQIARQRVRPAVRDRVTLQPTAIVNEALLKLLRQPSFADHTRAELLAAAAVAMRCVVIDYARGQQRQKRGGDLQRVTLDTADVGVSDTATDAIEMHELLTNLAELHPRSARVIEMRIYAGMTVVEVAEALDVSERTVKSDWRTAVAWLRSRLLEANE